MKILVTGGAGFIGSSLALSSMKVDPAAVVVAVDKLTRRGAELNLSPSKHAGVQFVHGLEEPIKRSPNQFSPNRSPMDRLGASHRFQTRLFKSVEARECI
jgi:nucleoside-diphosphate-sugar epimerase